MTDESFQRFGGLCAFLAALASLLYVISLYAGAGDGGSTAEAVLGARALNTNASWLLVALGLLVTVAIWALYGKIHEAGPAWSLWATSLGLLGGVMAAAHGLWDAARVPVLQLAWDQGSEAQQAAIAVFSGTPNPVDPRGLGTLLLGGLFALVAGALILEGKKLPRYLGQLGVAFGVVLIVAFVLGFVGPSVWRAYVAGLAFGILGPLWWLLVGRELI